MQTDLQNNSATRLARNPVVAFAVLIALSLVIGLGLMHPRQPDNDALRYIDYAINLHDHGIFSPQYGPTAGPPPPGNLHAPLYPAWVALFMRLDPDIRNSLGCIRNSGAGAAPCPIDFTLLRAAQQILAGVFFGTVWLLASRLSGTATIAWLAAAFALLSKSPLQYANQVLTEAILLPLAALFILFLVVAYQKRKARWMIAAGAALGFAALTRPAYAYLFFAVACVLLAGLVLRRQPRLLAAGLAFGLAYGVVVLPWMLRNAREFDRFVLTAGYAGDILSQRVAYNRMGWGEFGVAWIYWFPDIGDGLAKRFFPRRYFVKLKWEEGSYYATVAPALYDQALAAAKQPESVMPYLIRTEILGHPFKHALVTLPMIWRGVFVSKYWGIAGLICFVIVFVRHLRRRDYALLVASAPVWLMVVFHAFISVSIPRYNLPLIVLYAYALAHCAHAATARIAAAYPNAGRRLADFANSRFRRPPIS